MSQQPVGGRPEVVVLEHPAVVAAQGARRIVESLGRSRGPFSLALAGGTTPAAIYRLLSGPLAGQLPWDRITLFFGDERCVAPDHADSNHRMVKESLLDPLAAQGLAPHAVHRMEGERDPDDAAARYQIRLPPCFDLVLLGMGPDGHTASLFPESNVLGSREAVAATAEAHKGSRRITLTYPTLNAAQQLLVFVTGVEKAPALALALDGPPGAVPLRDVRPSDGVLTVLCDRAAAGEGGPASEA